MSQTPNELPSRGQAAVAQLDRPEDLKDVLKREESKYDCMSCRVMGGSAFLGLGLYTYFSGHHQLRIHEQEIMRSGTKIHMAARRLGISGTAAVLVGLGVYRFFG